MKNTLCYVLALIALSQVLNAKLYWGDGWAPGEAHCDQWRMACKKFISNPEKADDRQMCKIVKEGEWSVIDASCPDPNNPSPKAEAQRIQRMDPEWVNVNEVEFYTNIDTTKSSSKELCDDYRSKCSDAQYEARWVPITDTAEGMCYIRKNDKGELIALAACSAPNLGAQLGWKIIVT